MIAMSIVESPYSGMGGGVKIDKSLLRIHDVPPLQ